MYEQAYEYRNLLRHAVVEPTIFGEANSELLMWYDETGMRIRKYFAYAYYDDCPDDTVPPPGGGQSSAMSGMMTLGDGGGGGQCVYMTSDETLYLYDGGTLLCTFDKNDNVIEMFVNGPSGRVASYLYNRDDLLHYFLSDHLGSTRVLVHAPSGALPRVHQYMNYHPFGEVLEEYGSYNTNFKFTGKEHDRHSSFDYVYFGARYYKPKLGQFASIDKASQFASGYVYGANNPLIGVDADGNLFWVPIIIGAIAGGYGGAQIADARGADFLSTIGYVLGGAAIGAASGFVGGTVAGAVHNPVGGGLLAGAAAGTTNGLGMGALAGQTGRDLWNTTWHAGVSGAAGGLTAGMIGGKTGAFAGGFASGASGYALSHHNQRDQLWNTILAGSLSGAISYGAYQVEAGIRHKRQTGYPALDEPVNRQAAERLGRMSFAEDKENGFWSLDGAPPDVRTGDWLGINPLPRPTSATINGLMHFHPRTGGTAILTGADAASVGYPGARVTWQFMPSHSPADINFSHDLFTQYGDTYPSFVINPRHIYRYNVAPPIPYSPGPHMMGATDYYFMIHYYHLMYYGGF